MAFAEIIFVLKFSSSIQVLHLNEAFRRLLESLKAKGSLNGTDGVDSGECAGIVGVKSKSKTQFLMQVQVLLEYTGSYDFEDLREQFYTLFENESALDSLSSEAKCLSVERVYTDWLADDDVQSVVASYQKGE